jgi:hypothetical protein
MSSIISDIWLSGKRANEASECTIKNIEQMRNTAMNAKQNVSS